MPPCWLIVGRDLCPLVVLQDPDWGLALWVGPRLVSGALGGNQTGVWLSGWVLDWCQALWVGSIREQLRGS